MAISPAVPSSDPPHQSVRKLMSPVYRSRSADEKDHDEQVRQDKALLHRAREALDRLDFIGARDICSDALSSSRSNKADLFMLRSLAHGRIGAFEEAVADAEAALKEREDDPSVHIRAAFTHLASSIHHFQVAKQQTHDSEDLQLSSISTALRLPEIEAKLLEVKSLETRSPFERLSPELFKPILAWCDSPSLIMATSVCTEWKRLCFVQYPELFRHFKMRGRTMNILKGISRFNSISSDTIESFELDFVDQVKGASTFHLLESLITASSNSLKHLSMDGHGELGELMLNIVDRCPSLKTFIYTDEKEKIFKTPNHIRESSLSISPSGTSQPLIFVWESKHENLECGPTLKKRLCRATHVRILSEGVSQRFVTELLESSPKLEHLWIPFLDATNTEDLPPLKLPALQDLTLGHSLSSHSSRLFQTLEASNLRSIRFGCLHPDDLELMKSKLTLTTEFNLESLAPQGMVQDQVGAALLVQNIAGWRSLKRLGIEFTPASATQDFWIHLVDCLTLLSRESIELEIDDKSSIAAALPSLQHLVLGNDVDDQPGPELHRALHEEDSNVGLSKSLTRLVASRSAASKKLSLTSIALAANGLLEASNREFGETPSKENNSLVTNSIEKVEIKMKVMADENAWDWLKENVNEFKAEGFFLSGKGYEDEKWDRESESSDSSDEADTDEDLEGPILDIELGEDYHQG